MPPVLLDVCLWGGPILVAVICHEVAHGWVADRLGDPTARLSGRLTLNPLPHIDPVGTVLLPLALVLAHAPFVFGWARPVPVNFARLRHPRWDMVRVALAGPASNVALAVASAALVQGVDPRLHPWLWRLGLHGVVVNVVLAVFNLLPLLPLDGGRVVAGLLPRTPARAFARLEPYGLYILMALLFTRALDRVMGPVVTVMLRALL